MEMEVLVFSLKEVSLSTWLSRKRKRLFFFFIRMNSLFNVQTIALILAWVGTACWVVCFWWMHRLSSRQETMLQELKDVTKRIEQLSKDEHDLLREVHPNVERIKESVKDVAVAVKAEDSSGNVAQH
jgi:hypothetical protein